MNLTTQLKEQAGSSAKRHPGEAQTIMHNGIEELKNANFLQNAAKTGDSFPNFKLPNAKGEEVSLSNVLEKGKAVITFYRGGWCPYCNLELKAFQNLLSAFNEKNATLIAITPETPDNTLSTQEKNELQFEVLTSENNGLARDLNLVFKLPEDLVGLYGKFGINLEESQGNQANELPIAATYVVEQDGTIGYHFLAEDYKLRADPEEILENL